MFKKELTQDKVRKIIANIEDKIIEKINKEKVTINTVVSLVFTVWTDEITAILRKR